VIVKRDYRRYKSVQLFIQLCVLDFARSLVVYGRMLFDTEVHVSDHEHILCTREPHGF